MCIRNSKTGVKSWQKTHPKGRLTQMLRVSNAGLRNLNCFLL